MAVASIWLCVTGNTLEIIEDGTMKLVLEKEKASRERIY